VILEENVGELRRVDGDEAFFMKKASSFVKLQLDKEEIYMYLYKQI